VFNALGGLRNPNLPRREGHSKDQPTDGDETQYIDDRALGEARGSGLTAVNITLGYVAGAMDPFQSTLADFAVWDAFLAAHSLDLIKVLTGAHILEARASGRVGVILGFQNSDMLQGDVDRVDLFASMGLRMAQLTYNSANAAGGGGLSPAQGLTPFGREVLDRLRTRGVLADLSHSGERTCLEALEASPEPVCISHTGCRALADTPRNKTDRELRLLAEKGGVVGIFAMPFLVDHGQPMAQDFIRHLEHALQVCGEDHVGIGTDGPVVAIDDPEACLRAIQLEWQARRSAGISAPGETGEALLHLPDLTGPGQFRNLAGLLERRGHSASRIEKILGGNFFRLARDTWERNAS